MSAPGADEGRPSGAVIDVHPIGGAMPPDPEGVVAVLLHGRGSDEHDLQGLVGLLPPSWTVVTPRAVHAGEPWGYGAGWAWYRYIAEDRVVPETFDQSMEALDAFLDRLPEVLGSDPPTLVLGGFSQGGTLSMAYGLRHPGRVGAVLNFSGFLVDGLDLPEPDDAPPLFWGHGLHDPAIPYALAMRGRERLAKAGIEFATSDHPIGHGIVPEEVRDATRLVESALSARGLPPRSR